MQITKLKYPISVYDGLSLVSGKYAGYGSKSHWNSVLSSYYYSGIFDQAIIFDSTGGKYSVLKIFLYDLSLFNRLIQPLITSSSNKELCSVDMSLSHIENLSLKQMKQEFKDIVKKLTPSMNASESQEFEDTLRVSNTYSELINHTGVIEDLIAIKKAEFSKSLIVEDLRKT